MFKSARPIRVALAAGTTLLALAATAAGGVSATHAAAAPHHLTVEQIDQRVAKSMVQIDITYSAYVRYPLASGEQVWTDEPVESEWTCSGWFADSKGDIVTAGHCVDRTDSRVKVVDSLLSKFYDDGRIDDAWLTANQDWAERTWKVEAEDGSSTPDQKVVAFQAKKLVGATLTQPTAASVISVRPFTKEDVALLNVDVQDSIGLPVADTSPEVGADVSLVGFPGSVGDVVDPSTLAASFKSGTVSSRQTNANGVAKLEVNADISAGMSGGPAIDGRGRVVGINSFEINGESKDFNFITDTRSLRSFLARQDVRPAATFDRWIDHMAVTATQQRYLISGAGILAGGIVAIVLLLLVRRRRAGSSATELAPVVVPGSGRDGVPVDTAPITVPEAFIARCEHGHANPKGAAFCSQCGSGRLQQPAAEPAGVR